MKIKIESPDMIMWHWYEALKELGVDVYTKWITTEYKTRHLNPEYKEDNNYDFQIADHPRYFRGSAKTILYLCDVPKFSPNIGGIDYVFSASKMVGKTYFLPFGCPTNWFYEVPKYKRKGVCFVGNNHLNRWYWLEQLGVNCFVANWEESRHIYSQHKIRVMPPQIFADLPDNPSDMRTTSLYEGMSCNILTIAYKDKIPKLKNLVTYETQEEAKELIKYYLEHNKERDEIAKLQRFEVLMHHTWKDRMKEVLKYI